MDIVDSRQPVRPPRPRRRWPGVLAALAVVGAGTYAVTRPGPEPAPHPAPTPAAMPTPVATERPPRRPWQLPRLRERTGLALAGPSDGLLVMDVDTGRATAIGLPGDTLQGVEPVAPIEGGWLAFRREPCGESPCTPSALYAVRGGRTRLVARGHTAFADPDGRTVWVTRETPDSVPGLVVSWLERRTFSGSLVGPRTLLDAGDMLLGVTPEGPVLRREAHARAGVVLVRAATRERRVVVPDGIGVAVAGPRVAWTSHDCAVAVERCTLSVQDVTTGRSRTVRDVPGVVKRAALDPSGRYVAVVFDVGPDEFLVHVFDVTEGTMRAVQGPTSTPSVGTLAWSPDGRWLVVTTEYVDDQLLFQGHVVAVWHPGLRTAFAAPDFPGASGTGLVVAAA